MRVHITLVLLILLPLKADASAIALLRSFLEFYRTEVAVIIEKLNNTFGSSSALLAAEKEAAVTQSHTIAQIYKSEQGLISQTKYGTLKSIGRFKVGGITPSGCIRHKNGNIAADLMVNVAPLMEEIKEELDRNISTDEPSFRSVIKRSKDVAIIINGDDKDIVDPFKINKNISIAQARNLSKVVEYIVNPNPPNSSAQPNKINSAEFHAKRLRYEMFVHIVQTSMLNRITHYVRGNNNYSEHDLLMRLLAKSNSSTISDSMVSKYETGELREVNGTLSDILNMEIINKEIKADIVALSSIIAVDSTDKLADKL